MISKSSLKIRSITNDYYSSHEDSLDLQTQYLVKGISLKTKLFTRSPKLRSLIMKDLNITHDVINYETTREPNNFFNVPVFPKAHNFSIFFDDCYVFSLDSFPESVEFSGSYLMETLTQGVNGVLPKIFKANSINDWNLVKEKEYNLKISLKLEKSPSRQKFLIDLHDQISKIFEFINPVSLFRINSSWGKTSDVIPKKDFTIIKERLLLYGKKVNDHRYTYNQIKPIIEVLTPTDFGVKDILKIEHISQNFLQHLDNEVLINNNFGKDYHNLKNSQNLINILKDKLHLNEDKIENSI